MRRLGVVLAIALVACESVVTPSPSPPPTLSPTASPSPIVAREETPRLLLSIPYAPPTVDRLGATATRLGGVTPRGPTSLAVDETDRIYIWDRARLRVAVYADGRFERAIALPYVQQESGALLVGGGRLYLRAATQVGVLEYEIDGGTGALLRAVSPSSATSSIYPRRRTGPQPAAARYTFGADAAGLDYLYAAVDYGANSRYERVDLGHPLAFALEPAPQKLVDAYPRADGALYELAADYGGVGSVYVYALLAPSAASQPPSPGPATVAAPPAFGRPVPDRLTASLAGAGSVDLDARTRMAVWWLASVANERTDLPAPSQDPLFVARWNDGSRLDIVVADGGLLFVDGKIYLGPATAYEQLASYVLSSPSRLAELAAGGPTVRIADLPGMERSLTVGEIAELRSSLSKGFVVSQGELPFLLEDPFPLYEIRLGSVVIRLRGDDYGDVGDRRTGAFVHDGTLDDLARRWLPAPTLSVDDPHSLFLADKVTFEQPGYFGLQDISRWRASLVRALNAKPGPAGSPELDSEPPATLVFRFPSGRVETVTVRPGSFTYRGRVIALRGVMYLVYYRGVP